jgi:hypothetical protein
VSETRFRLEQYLTRIGMSCPADAAQQYQVALMRQWADHLDIVLEHNLPDQPELRSTIIREFIYGAVPQAAEADLRAEMATEMTQLRERMAIRPEDAGMPPEWRP